MRITYECDTVEDADALYARLRSKLLSQPPEYARPLGDDSVWVITKVGTGQSELRVTTEWARAARPLSTIL